jgi:hypothetical protein
MQTTAFDMSLVQCGARLRRSPYYEASQRYGPLGFTMYNHMLFPIRFDVETTLNLGDRFAWVSGILSGGKIEAAGASGPTAR